MRIPWNSRRSLATRSRQILATLTRHGLGWFFARFEAGATTNSALRRIVKQGGRSEADEIVQALIALGPTFIKFGQALGARADLLPHEYVVALNRLVDEVTPAPFEQIQEVLKKELGRDPHEVYAELTPTPIASASIGQVYAARLWTGENVVVKVVRPGSRDTFEMDLEIMADIADWAHAHTALGRLYNLPILVEEFAHTVRGEFDYLREAANADAFRRNFHTDSRVYIPKIYWDFTTRQVITLERVSGIRLLDVASLRQAEIDLPEVARNLMHFALRQIFEFGLYHADPHGGNFFIQPDASLAVVDFGMVGRLTHQTKRTFLGIAMAIERTDADILVDELLAAGIYTHGIDRKSLTRDFERLFDKYTGASLRTLSASEVVSEIMTIVLRHGLQLPGELVAMTRAVTISAGTGSQLYPAFNLLEFSAPYVNEFWRTERSPGNMLPRVGQAAIDGFELSLNLPRRLMRLLGQIERGQLEVGVNSDLIREVLSQLQKMTNRMALAMILAAVIIALSLVLAVFQSSVWQNLGEVIFGFALVSSILFGIWLVLSIIRSGRT